MSKEDLLAACCLRWAMAYGYLDRKSGRLGVPYRQWRATREVAVFGDTRTLTKWINAQP